ncbi:transporter substrate-binding domain-containing protein [Microbacterium sp. NPDC077644]|uniref:transporter substrate-binding domain-containing protein n=1 Tax=Microbacterium sp. NPDC077644 TaxID=3155055 RepID=UPI00344FB816
MENHTMKWKKLTGAALAALLAAAALTGCAAAIDPSATAPADGVGSCEPFPSGDPLAAPELTHEDEVADLTADLSADIPETLRVAVMPDFPGVNFDSDGERRGFEPDLLRAATERIGVDLKFVLSNSPLSEVEAGRADAMAVFLNDTLERQALGAFFIDYMEAGVSAIVPECNPDQITEARDLCGKKVAAGVGTVQLTQLTSADAPDSYVKLCQDAGLDAPVLVESQTTEAAVTTVQAGRADALVIDTPVATAIAQSSDGALTLAYSATVEGQPIAVFLSPVVESLAEPLAASYQSLIDDGTYETILGQYNIDTGHVSEITINGATR